MKWLELCVGINHVKYEQRFQRIEADIVELKNDVKEIKIELNTLSNTVNNRIGKLEGQMEIMIDLLKELVKTKAT